MSHEQSSFGGIIHTYQKYDPQNFPPPTQPPPDVLSGAFEHLLAFGNLRELTDEELARAVHLDPSQFASLGPTLESLRRRLLERKRTLLEQYETENVRQSANHAFRQSAERLTPPREHRDSYERAVRDEQIRELERLWYRAGGERSGFAKRLLGVVQRLSDKYLIDQLSAQYTFTGRELLTIERAQEVFEELTEIDRLLKQLEEAAQTAQLAIIDIDQLADFAEQADLDQLQRVQEDIQRHLRELAEQQGLERDRGAFQMTPKAYRLFQNKLLERIFSDLLPSRTGRHRDAIEGEGAVELPVTKPYEFGDSVSQMDIPASFVNAWIRSGGARLPLELKNEDIEIQRTRNTPKCATVVLMDMSGSMRYDALYVNVKRMALALDGLIRREYPGDLLRFFEVFSLAKAVAPGDVAALLPKPVTIFDPVVARRYDMSKPHMSESLVPPHFTNLQHGLQLARRTLATQDTPNRQVILITDGLPTAHFEQEQLYLLYPPQRRTEEATLREGLACQREQITINIFLLPSWSQTQEDVRFAYRLAESTRGRVFFTAGRDLDRYVVWDYLQRRRSIIR